MNLPEQIHFDTVIVGAGISGIDAAYRLSEKNPKLSYVVLEGRSAIGGTWDLFRYPGIRSDSDIVTLGFPFHPFRGDASIVSGATIRDYVVATARHFGIDEHVRFGHAVVSVSWSTAEARWTVDCDVAGESVRFTCGFLLGCAGYYAYDRAHAPDWPGTASFAGRIVHPQFWPSDLDVGGKRVVVIGSGATAVTLVPAIAETAAHVTMVQRSPSYVAALPSHDAIASRLRARLPRRLAGVLVRWKNVAYSSMTYRIARRRPDRFRELLRAGVLRAFGAAYDAASHDVDVHFNPSYRPWDQRVCVAPDGDLFTALGSGRASIATGRIAEFSRDGIRLEDGRDVPADIVVTATGLTMRFFGGIAMSVDGRAVDIAKRLVYKGAMLERVPNFAFAFGYTHSSWTLKVDVNARYVANLIRFMRKHRFGIAVPVPTTSVERKPLLGLTSGYVTRSEGAMPQRGPLPWRIHDNYALDLAAFLTGRIADGTLRFAKTPPGHTRAAIEAHVPADARENPAVPSLR